MKTSLVSHYFLIAFMLGAFVFVCILFAPYLAVFVLAMVFGVIFAPVNQWLRKYMKPLIAAILTTLLIIIIVSGPVAIIISQIVGEASGIAGSLESGTSVVTNAPGVAVLQEKIQTTFPSFSIDIAAYIHQGLQWVASRIGDIFSSVLVVGLNLFLALIALVYWFKDSGELRTSVLRTSPLGDSETRTIMRALSVSIHGVIKGTLIVAMIQGVVAGIGFAIFGVPNAVLWGTVAAICALVPTLGTTLIMLPIVGYLLLTGHIPQAIGMLVWAVFAVGLIDNIIGPKLMSRGSTIHPFFILISVLGGVKLFGPIGLFAGPLVVAFFFALFDTYGTYLDEKKIAHKNA